ncbi:MAG: hypothetical protein KME10_17995 [Plectolyngbya sp. WJT66-NPBG17]|jgi:hypothetical protein|nr:hypothetical protein [Plectolyngbya sp. WJT66-NPBG17]
MTEEEVKTLFATCFEEVKTTLLAEVDHKNKGLAAALQRDIKKISEKQPPESPADLDESGEATPRLSLKALQQQISDLTTQLSEKDKQAFASARNAAIAQLVAGSPTQHKGTLLKLFTTEYGDKLRQENTDWYVDLGGDSVKPLAQTFTDYLASEEGKIFIPPSPTSGSGSASSAKPTPSSGGKELSLDEQYAALQAQMYA